MSAKAAGKRPLRSLTAHEKLDAIRRVHDGESKASVARDIGVPESTLRGWCKNEDKISYLSRQSSPETDDSQQQQQQQHQLAPPEPKEKKARLEEPPAAVPFNLSLKEQHKSKPESPKSQQMSERERNRAELARLSVELGLNRPEMVMSSSMQDLSANVGLLTQWKNLLLLQQQQLQQQQQQQQQQQMQQQPKIPTYNNSGDEKPAILPRADKTPSVEETVWNWLKTQTQQNLAQASSVATTSAACVNVDPQQNNSSWFWKWYKQFAYAQNAAPEKPPILYQQLMKTAHAEDNAENNTLEEKPAVKNPTKARAVLDNLLLHNNNNNNNVGGKEEATTQSEALEHGDKFLRWLERCGDPAVTAMQVMQFRFLLNNIRSGADRKPNGIEKKVRRK